MRGFFCCPLFLAAAACLSGGSLAAAAGSTNFSHAFKLPTANRFIFDPGKEDLFFAPTVGKTWTSGCYGCVRTDGWQLHEGIDIRTLRQDAQGEPVDPILAIAPGTVAYVNRKPSLSNYGNYIILKHQIEGLEVYSLYAHMDIIRPHFKPGVTVVAGEELGIMGRTANTHQTITKDRAHLHFELNLLVNDRFSAWFQKNCPGQRNDHGDWNGRNLMGIDARLLFLAERDQGAKFNLLQFIQNQPALCRVLVRKTSFPWLKRYAPMVRDNPTARKEGVAGYEIALNFVGLPIELIPRAESEIKGSKTIQLLSVNAAEQQRNRCGRIVQERGGKWTLTNSGEQLIGLLTF